MLDHTNCFRIYPNPVILTPIAAGQQHRRRPPALPHRPLGHRAPAASAAADRQAPPAAGAAQPMRTRQLTGCHPVHAASNAAPGISTEQPSQQCQQRGSCSGGESSGFELATQPTLCGQLAPVNKKVEPWEVRWTSGTSAQLYLS